MPEIRAAVDGLYRAIDHALLTASREPPKRDRSPPSAGRLMRTIESEVIPRLLLIHGVSPAEPRSRSGVTAADVELLASHLLARSDNFVDAFVLEIEARGVDLETLLLDLLAPSARLLGVMWEEDLCDFTDVTIALARLQRLLRTVSGRFEMTEEWNPSGPTVLLAVTPGEQHTFGLTLVSEFFRRAGWSVFDEIPETETEVVQRVRQQWFSVVGFSLSGELLRDRLASVIKSVRMSSRNRKVGVIVGGAMFQEHPEWVSLVGADASANDGLEAVVQSQSLSRLKGE
ncbi:cobalamin B12-binding domain-containing protein [Thalassobaculum litoreum]|nr:cobalamin B12-binding domain-containing protein [Thalassobaculum litoreum]